MIVLSATSASISIVSFATVIGTPVWKTSASHSLLFSLSTGIVNDSIFGHEDFMIIINEERNYRELKESITKMNSQRSDAEKTNLIEEGKKLGMNEVINRNEIINNSLNYQI